MIELSSSGNQRAAEPIHSALLTLTFYDLSDSTRIELVHVNVPDGDFAGVSEGWLKYYRDPWREYLITESSTE